MYSCPCTQPSQKNNCTTRELRFEKTSKIFERIKLKSSIESRINHIFFMWFNNLQKAFKKFHNRLYFLMWKMEITRTGLFDSVKKNTKLLFSRTNYRAFLRKNSVFSPVFSAPVSVKTSSHVAIPQMQCSKVTMETLEQCSILFC